MGHSVGLNRSTNSWLNLVHGGEQTTWRHPTRPGPQSLKGLEKLIGDYRSRGQRAQDVKILAVILLAHSFMCSLDVY